MNVAACVDSSRFYYCRVLKVKTKCHRLSKKLPELHVEYINLLRRETD